MDEHEPRHRPHNTSSTGPRAGLLKLPGRRSDATNRFGSIRALLFGLSFTFDNSPADSPPINGTFVAGLCLSHAATETQLSRSCQRFANGFRKMG